MLELTSSTSVVRFFTTQGMAKDLDVQLQRIPVMVANMTIIGMNVLHAAAGGRLPVYQYGVDEPNIAQGGQT